MKKKRTNKPFCSVLTFPPLTESADGFSTTLIQKCIFLTFIPVTCIILEVLRGFVFLTTSDERGLATNLSNFSGALVVRGA